MCEEIKVNRVTIYEYEMDDETHYGVKLEGDVAEIFGQEVFESFEDSLVDAHELAEQAADAGDCEITWECYKPGWAK
ncbi:hypothetical protein AHP1_941 [Aeromonas phage Ahp1_CNU-2021]|nr:hypothetical protein AHP1_941 [Aeromonas phage Ahp1_CNU-2021]